MNGSCCNKTKVAVYAVTIIGCFLILAALVKIMQTKTGEDITAARYEERRKNLITHQAEAMQAAQSYSWVDQGKGLVRLPIERAIEIALQELQNPAAARSNLIARADKAAEPPPKPPEVPSEFE